MLYCTEFKEYPEFRHTFDDIIEYWESHGRYEFDAATIAKWKKAWDLLSKIDTYEKMYAIQHNNDRRTHYGKWAYRFCTEYKVTQSWLKRKYLHFCGVEDILNKYLVPPEGIVANF